MSNLSEDNRISSERHQSFKKYLTSNSNVKVELKSLKNTYRFKMNLQISPGVEGNTVRLRKGLTPWSGNSKSEHATF